MFLEAVVAYLSIIPGFDCNSYERKFKTSFRIGGLWAQFLNGDNPYHEARMQVT
jgi:hypothetical protein